MYSEMINVLSTDKAAEAEALSADFIVIFKYLCDELAANRTADQAEPLILEGILIMLHGAPPSVTQLTEFHDIVWFVAFLLSLHTHDPVSNVQLGLVYKRVHTADTTGQNCSVFRTTENSLDLSTILFTPPTRQDSLVRVGRVSCELDLCCSYMFLLLHHNKQVAQLGHHTVHTALFSG